MTAWEAIACRHGLRRKALVRYHRLNSADIAAVALRGFPVLTRRLGRLAGQWARKRCSRMKSIRCELGHDGNLLSSFCGSKTRV